MPQVGHEDHRKYRSRSKQCRAAPAPSTRAAPAGPCAGALMQIPRPTTAACLAGGARQPGSAQRAGHENVIACLCAGAGSSASALPGRRPCASMAMTIWGARRTEARLGLCLHAATTLLQESPCAIPAPTGRRRLRLDGSFGCRITRWFFTDHIGGWHRAPVDPLEAALRASSCAPAVHRAV